MVEVAQTRELFSALISRPALEDRLLQRPPFKFIHDIVVETIRATGYLSSMFTSDELDSRKAGLNRDTKIAFIQKLIDALNADGDLNDVSPAKLVAGKEPDKTNQMLQQLAIQAAAANIGRPSKQSREKKRRKSSSSHPQQQLDSKVETPASRERQRQDKKKEVEREKRRLSKALYPTDSAGGIDATSGKKPKKSEDKKKDKSKKEGKEKSSKSRDKSREKSKKSKELEPEHSVDEGIGSTTPHLSQRREDIASPILRESSGGTSKADDSGIAESNEHEVRESERQSSAVSQNHTAPEKTAGYVLKMGSPESKRSKDEDYANMQRPATAGRPQTAIGRPSTAAARPGPPKIKKTKIGDMDPTAITPQPAAFEKSAVIQDDSPGAVDNDFVLDEEEERHETLVVNTNIAADLDASEEHGALVNKIIANTQDIQRNAVDLDELGGMDPSEANKLRADVELCRNSLQSVAQTVQPLSRTLEFVAEDFDVLLREIDESRKRRANAQRQLAERARQDDGSAALLAKLKVYEAELAQVRGQIAKTTASIIENERRINIALNLSV